jgi:HEAT repeat protein
MRALAALLLLSAAALGGPGDEAFEKAREELADETPAVRVRGCRRLGGLGERRAIRPLVKMLEDRNPGVRVAAVDALAQIGDEVAVPGLVRLLEDESAAVRGRVLIALGNLAGKYVGPRLAPCLKDPDPGVRVSAVVALGALRDPVWAKAVRDLLDRTEDDPDHVLLSTAIVALTKMEGKKAYAGLYVRDGGAEAFGSWLVRASLVWAVGENGDRERLDFAKRCFASSDHRVFGAAAAALVKLGEHAPVLGDLKSESPSRRRVAVAALAESGDVRWRDALLELARDSDRTVRLEVAVGLSKMGVRESFPLLLRGLVSASTLVWAGCAGELKRAYGVDFGRNPDRWVAWYEKHRDRLTWDAAKRIWRVE